MKLKTAKTVVAGITGVGKTSIITKVVTNNFTNKIKPTLGSDFFTVECDDQTTGGKICFEIWDTAGQEQYKALSTSFFRDAIIAILVYDITNRDSLKGLDDYIKILNDIEPNCFIVILGNKRDLELDRKITMQEGMSYANLHNSSLHMETSAYSGEGIDQIFPTLARQQLNFKEKKLELTEQPEKKKKNRC